MNGTAALTTLGIMCFILLVQAGSFLYHRLREEQHDVLEPPVLEQQSPVTWAAHQKNVVKMTDYFLALREEQHTTKQMLGRKDEDDLAAFNVVPMKMRRRG